MLQVSYEHWNIIKKSKEPSSTLVHLDLDTVSFIIVLLTGYMTQFRLLLGKRYVRLKIPTISEQSLWVQFLIRFLRCVRMYKILKYITFK